MSVDGDLFLNSLSSFFEKDLNFFIAYLRSLLSQTPNDFNIYSKLGQLYYLQH